MSFLQLQTGLNVAGNVLHDLKTKCLKAINEACERAWLAWMNLQVQICWAGLEGELKSQLNLAICPRSRQVKANLWCWALLQRCYASPASSKLMHL